MHNRWGCSHEKDATDSYKKYAIQHHHDFEVQQAGLFLDKEIPFIGASPDGIISCKCCWKGVLEVKCPFCVKEGLPDEESEDFCMELQNNKWVLKRKHQYF